MHCANTFVYYMLELTEYQRERLELIEHKLKFVTERPLVLCIEGPDHLKPASLYMDELVTLAGGGHRGLFSVGGQGCVVGVRW